MLHWCQWHRDVQPSAQLQLFTILHLLLLLFSPLPTATAASLYISWLTSVSVCVSRRNIFNWISNFILTWNSIYKRSRKEKENGTFLLDTRENIFSKFEFKVKFVASLPESDSWWCPGSRHLLSPPAPAPPRPRPAPAPVKVHCTPFLSQSHRPGQWRPPDTLSLLLFVRRFHLILW